MKVAAWILPIALALAICCSGAEEQPPAGILDSSKFVTVTPITSVDAARPGDTFHAGVVLDVKEGYHAYGTPLPEYLIPTKLVFDNSVGFSISSVKYPPPKEEYIKVLKSSIMTYDGTIVVAAELRVDQQLGPGTYGIAANITYQACDQNTCYKPIRNKQIKIPITIVPEEEQAKEINRDIFAFSSIGRGPHPGDQAPDLSVKDSAGKTVALSQFKGKRNLLIIFQGGPESAEYLKSLRDSQKELDKLNTSLLHVEKSATSDFDRFGLTLRVLGTKDLELISGLVIVDKHGKLAYGKAVKSEADWPEISELMEILQSASN